MWGSRSLGAGCAGVIGLSPIFSRQVFFSPRSGCTAPSRHPAEQTQRYQNNTTRPGKTSWPNVDCPGVFFLSPAVTSCPPSAQLERCKDAPRESLMLSQNVRTLHASVGFETTM